MNTPDQPRMNHDDAVAPDAPFANRLRERQVRRRLSFDDDRDEGNERKEYWRLRAIEVHMHRGLPVHTERTICVELCDGNDHRLFNEPLDFARLIRGSYVYRELLENGHASYELNHSHDEKEPGEDDEEYKRRIQEDFRSIVYIKL